MSLESASWITELDTSNPTATDTRSQGDDHLRLLKTVLKANFPTASKAWYNPSTVAKTANYSVLATDMNKTILIDTDGGAFTLTLPTLVSGDAGWECWFLKTTNNDTPYFIVPPSGTFRSGEYTGLSKVRRCIPGSRVNALWTGSGWIIQRSVHVPIGTIMPTSFWQATAYHNDTKPYGWERPHETALDSTNYPEFNAVVYTETPDTRGRYLIGYDPDGAGPIDDVDISGIGWVSGGQQSKTILQANLPSVDLTTTIAAGQGSHTHTGTTNAIATGGAGAALGSAGGQIGTITINSATLPQMTGTTPLGGSGTALSTLSPFLALQCIIAVE